MLTQFAACLKTGNPGQSGPVRDPALLASRRVVNIRLDMGVLGFPGISVGVEDIALPSRRRKKKAERAGPFLLIARDCGLALDTGRGNQSGSVPHLWLPHADRHQLWFLHPSGIKDEVVIVSAANGLALDSTTDSQQASLIMWEPHTEPWQRWRLKKAPDGAAFEIQGVHTQRFLTASDSAENGWTPWFEDRNFVWSQQWIFALPHGGDPTTR